MKTLLGAAMANFLAVGLLAAATNAPTANYGYHSSTDATGRSLDSQITKQIPPGQGKAAPNGQFAPRPTGAAYDLYRDGPIVLAPWAPASYGKGEQNMSATVPASHTPNSRDNPGKPTDFGGIKLFGWDF